MSKDLTLTTVPVANSDSYCGPKNYCTLGTFFSNPVSYTISPLLSAQAVSLCQLSQVYNPTSNPKVYDWGTFQRLHYFSNSFETSDANNFITNLCANYCSIPQVCSGSELYYDLSKVISPKGMYRPIVNCHDLHKVDGGDSAVPALATDLEYFTITRTSSTVVGMIATQTKVTDRYTNSCFYIPDLCVVDPLNLISSSSTCCPEGACSCPPGFGCDVDDLAAPLICSAGYWRLSTGLTRTDIIFNVLGTGILDFMDPTRDLFKAYQSYYYSLNSVNPIGVNDYIANFQGLLVNTRCLLCPPGYFCPRGSVQPIICPIGTYCQHQYESALSCKRGSYNNQVGQYMCTPCEIGHYCPSEKMTAPSPCPAGFFCPLLGSGTTDVTYKGNDFNSTSPCPPSYYCPAGMGTIGTKCPAGSKCPAMSSQPIPCNPGTFQNSTLSTTCYDCPRGFFCLQGGLTQPVPCTPGRICPATHLTSASEVCPPGYICDTQRGYNPGDLGLTDVNTKYPGFLPALCEPGFYCNQGTSKSISVAGDITSPQMCNKGQYNPLPGQSSCSNCEAGFQCITQGLVNEVPCPVGTFRPNDSKIISCVLCPDGTYGYETGYSDKTQCIACPPGVVCVAQGLVLDDFNELGKYLF